MVRRGPPRQWVVAYYETKFSGWHKGTRVWTPAVAFNKAKIPDEGFVKREDAFKRAIGHNNRVAELRPFATHEVRAMVFYGKGKPRSIIEYSIFE